MNWLAKGDANPKYFHRFVNHRHAINHIWSTQSQDGTWSLSFYGAIMKEGVSLIEILFKDGGHANVVDQMIVDIS